jgi:hypothetical protein
MRLLALFALDALAAFSQLITLGVKGGVPVTDFLSVTQSPGPVSAISNTNRYIVGPTLELRLPAYFSVEFDALVRHFSYRTTIALIGHFDQTTATSNAWEFPLLLKYKLRGRFVRPYINGGVAWDRLQGLSATRLFIGSDFVPTTTQTSNPPELQNTTSTGVVIGGGVDIHALVLHISPELRYTRWTSQHFTFDDALHSNQNQAEFLLGITF